MNHITTCIMLIISLFYFPAANADQTNCTKEDVIGRWTTYSIDFGVADHVEYQEKVEVVFLQTINEIDQFTVTFSGGFSDTIDPWEGTCVGDVYVLNGEFVSHNNVHTIQAVRNASAPATDQCSLERCESTCIGDLISECSISKTLLSGKLSFFFLPGHATTGAADDNRYLASSSECFSHDCNHPGAGHTHGPD